MYTRHSETSTAPFQQTKASTLRNSLGTFLKRLYIHVYRPITILNVTEGIWGTLHRNKCLLLNGHEMVCVKFSRLFQPEVRWTGNARMHRQ